MSEFLGELLKLQQQLNGPALAGHPDVEETRLLLKRKIDDSVSRIVPAHIIGLDREHGLSGSFHGALETYERHGLFEGKKKEKNALMSPKEVRDNAPGIGAVMEALKTRPELLEKFQQGFTKLHPVPFGLSPTSFRGPMGKAIKQYHGEGKLRSSDGTKLRLDESEPVWMWDAYEGADANGKLVYFPDRFDPQNHGGKTKKQILEASKFPGWQVLLIENLRDIPRAGKGQVIGGRKQIEANQTPHQYLELLGAGGHTLEAGLTPEAWQSLFLTRLDETGGEVLDDYRSGAACYCTGAYFPSSGYVPGAYWYRDLELAFVGRGVPGCRDSGSGARAGVRVF